MKQLKKQVLLALCMVMCLFALTACTTKAKEDPSLSEMESVSLQESTKMVLEQVVAIEDASIERAIEQYRDNEMEALASGMESYGGVKQDLGAYKSVTGGSAEKTEDGYSITLNEEFEQRMCEFNITLDKKMTAITSMSFNPVYTTGENMTKAALNTLMGMGTVFIVLIFISWLISCFRYVNKYEDKMKQKKTPAAPIAVKTAPAAVSVQEENLSDDLELVAVITAAIAASTGASADGLVVRSIRRASGSKWKRA